jgi:glycosyltransferase involved in cell wall biosynthesis
MNDHSDKIMLSICCLTFNQADSIGKALNSFLEQRTTFSFEIVVHDDASDDATFDIIREYVLKYPTIIRAIRQEKNLVKSGTGIYEIYTKYVIPELKGKYIAICEGDDYWTDPEKLQRQVDYLESHPDFTICFHHVGIQRQGRVDESAHLRNTGMNPEGDTTYTLSDLIRGNLIPNCSVVYRNCITQFPACFNGFPFPDWSLHILYAEKGHIRYIHRNMAVHRDSPLGLWNGLRPEAQRVAECNFLLTLLNHLPSEFDKAIIDSLQNFSSTYQTVTFWDVYRHAIALAHHEKDVMKSQYEAILEDIYRSRKWKLAVAFSKVFRLLSFRFKNRNGLQ